MSGHSKWSTIKRKKGAADAKRGKLFSKLIRQITASARVGGADPNGNPRLRLAIDKAKEANMPTENIDRAIKKGAGQLEGVSFEETNLEGYGPGGIAVLVDALTDNKNRTVAEIRHIFSRMGGSLGEVGCVSWMFQKKGVLTFDKSVGEEKLFDIALSAGADDIQNAEDILEVFTGPQELTIVKEACEKAGLKSTESEFRMIAQNQVHLEGAEAERLLKLLESLEDHDDVQNVYANYDIDAVVMEKILS